VAAQQRERRKTCGDDPPHEGTALRVVKGPIHDPDVIGAFLDAAQRLFAGADGIHFERGVQPPAQEPADHVRRVRVGVHDEDPERLAPGGDGHASTRRSRGKAT
jgi:hypothetical protein